MTPTRFAVALGSNLGDRERILGDAVGVLSSRLGTLRVSKFYDTEPVGYRDQPRFLNAVVAGTTLLTARELLDALLEVEKQFGRVRTFPNAPRTLDLDLIFYGDVIIASADLQIPHPRFRERAFVLDPLSDVEPDWKDPVTGSTVRQLHARLNR